MSQLTQSLIETIFAKLGERFNQLVRERYESDEGQRFLMTITDFYHINEERQVKQGIVNYLTPAIADIESTEIRKLFANELDFMYIQNNDKAVSILRSTDTYYQDWNFYYHMILANTGMMNIEVGGAENLNISAIQYVMEYKAKSAENLDKFNRYIQCYQDLQKYYRYLGVQTSSNGSIKTYEEYLQPLLNTKIKDLNDARYN